MWGASPPPFARLSRAPGADQTSKMHRLEIRPNCVQVSSLKQSNTRRSDVVEVDGQCDPFPHVLPSKEEGCFVLHLPWADFTTDRSVRLQKSAMSDSIVLRFVRDLDGAQNPRLVDSVPQ